MFGIKKYFLKWLLNGFNDLYDEYAEEVGAVEQQADAHDWKPPARYCIRASGSDIWCDDYRTGPGGCSIEAIWTQNIGGKEKPVTCSIYDSSLIIIDYETEITREVFDRLKKEHADSIHGENGIRKAIGESYV